MSFLSGKKILITGVLSNRSIAYGIAKSCHAQGAELAFSYVGERFKDRITEFAADFNSKLIFDCDVGNDEQINKLFQDLSQHWPQFDGFVHSIGYAPKEAIAGDFMEGLSREGVVARFLRQFRRQRLCQHYKQPHCQRYWSAAGCLGPPGAAALFAARHQRSLSLRRPAGGTADRPVARRRRGSPRAAGYLPAAGG